METKPTGSSHIINIGKANQTGAYTYACMNVCSRVRECVCSVCVVCVCVVVCVDGWVCVSLYRRVIVNSRTHTHTITYTHTYVYVCVYVGRLGKESEIWTSLQVRHLPS